MIYITNDFINLHVPINSPNRSLLSELYCNLSLTKKQKNTRTKKGVLLRKNESLGRYPNL